MQNKHYKQHKAVNTPQIDVLISECEAQQEHQSWPLALCSVLPSPALPAATLLEAPAPSFNPGSRGFPHFLSIKLPTPILLAIFREQLFLFVRKRKKQSTPFILNITLQNTFQLFICVFPLPKNL